MVLNQLHQYSRLTSSFGINILVWLTENPKLSGLKELLHYHLVHRKDVIIKRTKYDLGQAQQRVHILEGLLVALNNVDEVVAGIKKSRTVEDARTFLTSTYSLTIEQANAILDLRLQKIASLEQEKIRNEHTDLLQKIIFYEEVLGSEQKVYGLIKEELEEIKATYGDGRRSRVIRGEYEDADMEELIKEETVVVTMTNSGYVKRLPLDTYKTQKARR